MARVTADEMSNEFAEKRISYRGTEYVMRELPMDEYDKTVKLATTTIRVDGEDVEKFDNVAHTKILVAKSLVSPKLTADQLYGKGTRLVRQLTNEVGKLHWDPEPEDKAKADDGEGEATAPANP